MFGKKQGLRKGEVGEMKMVDESRVWMRFVRKNSTKHGALRHEPYEFGILAPIISHNLAHYDAANMAVQGRHQLRAGPAWC